MSVRGYLVTRDRRPALPWTGGGRLARRAADVKTTTTALSAKAHARLETLADHVPSSADAASPTTPELIVSPMNVGLRELRVADEAQGVQLPVTVLYPTDATASPLRFGPYEVQAARDADVVGNQLPIVLVSHGNAGSPWTHRETARELARAGMIVVLVEHIGNSRSDSSLTGSVAILAHRPRHLRLALHAVLSHEAFADVGDATRLAIVGHSIGAYTALAVAGGRPTTTHFDSPLGATRAVPVVPDHRVRALVLLAPAAGWYQEPESLSAVHASILILTGDADRITPHFHADIIARGLPLSTRVRQERVAGAGHHAFQTPFPASMVSPDFPPSQDPPDFDRVAYHPQLNAQILAFLQTENS